jgi:hypothetical protein
MNQHDIGLTYSGVEVGYNRCQGDHYQLRCLAAVTPLYLKYQDWFIEVVKWFAHSADPRGRRSAGAIESSCRPLST